MVKILSPWSQKGIHKANRLCHNKDRGRNNWPNSRLEQ
jgi:hypothetical protein